MYGAILRVVEVVQTQHAHLLIPVINVIKCHVIMDAEVLLVEEIVILDVVLFVIMLVVMIVVPKDVIAIVHLVV